MPWDSRATGLHRVVTEKQGYVQCSCGAEFKSREEWEAHYEGMGE